MSEVTESLLRRELIALTPDLHRTIATQIAPAMRSIISPEDITQRVGVRLSAGGSLPSHLEDIRAWLFTVTRNELIREINNARRIKRGGAFRQRRIGSQTPSSCLDLFNRIAGLDPSPSSMEASSQAIDAMHRAIDELPTDTQTAIRIHYIDGLSVRQAASTMNRPAFAVRRLLRAGLQQLHRRIRTHYPSSDMTHTL